MLSCPIVQRTFVWQSNRGCVRRLPKWQVRDTLAGWGLRNFIRISPDGRWCGLSPKALSSRRRKPPRRELQELIEELRTRRGRFALIADPSEAPVPSAAVRREAGLFVAELFRMKEPECVGIAMVASSTVLRGALRAVLWFVDPDKPCTVCGSRVEAERWAQRALGGGLDAMAP